MSHFSDLLTKCIKDSPYNIKNLAANSQIDRTVIQKYLSGERLPNSYKNIEKIIAKLALTTEERRILKRAYDIEKLGINKYNHLMKLKELIENIRPLSTNNKVKFQLDYQFEQINNLVTNQHDLLILIQYLITKTSHIQNPELRLYIPADQYIYPQILHLFQQFSTLTIYHLLHFENDENSRYNLHNFNQFNNCFSALLLKNYHLKYKYDNFISTFSSSLAYPYMILTKENTLLIDSYIQSGILIHNDDNNHFIQQFDEIYFTSNKFYHQLNEKEYFDYFDNLIQEDDIKLFSYRPNTFLVLDDDLIDYHYLGNINQKILIKDKLKQYKQTILQAKSANISIYFTKQGLDSFYQTGLTNPFATESFLPLSKEEVILVLKRILHLAKSNDNYNLYLIDEQKFNFPQNSCIIYNNNTNLLITLFNNNNIHLILDELTIKKDFCYLHELIKIEEYQYDQKDTLIFLEQFINEKI